MRSALVRKQSYIEVSAGDLHHEVRDAANDGENTGECQGDSPDENQGETQIDIMPICCGVLRAEMCDADQVIREAPHGRGPALTIRFVIPRV